jgi:hypothetical protein
MTTRRFSTGIATAAALIIVMSGGRLAAQQSSLAALPEEPPEVVLYRLGPVLVDPKVSIPELGTDSNIFNEPTNPQADFVIKLVPEIDFFTELGLLRVAVKSASTFTYFHRTDSERSIAEQIRGRATARFSRLRPWVGGASLRSNERTSEIDARAQRVDREAAAGVEFEVSTLAALSVSGNRMSVRYPDREQYRDAALAEALNRTTDMVAASLRLRATPFTSVTVRGYTARDQFEFDATRNAQTQGGDVEVQFAPEAVIRGTLGLGFRRQEFADPSLTTFQGVTARGAVTSLLLWRAMLGLEYQRDVHYSYDRREGYYIENSADIVYTQRISGPFDAQGRVSRHVLDYGASQETPRREGFWSYQAGVGYSLDGGSRFGVSYEIAERNGTAFPRQFSRRRLFGSFTYEFWK